MKYEEFKILIESKVLTREEYLQLRERIGKKETILLFDRYIEEKDALNNEEQFKYIVCYYFEDLENDSDKEKENKVKLPGKRIDSIREYIDQTTDVPLLTELEEKELSKKINKLYNSLKETILLSDTNAKKILASEKEESQRELEEILIDNYFNSKLISFNYNKTLKLKPLNKNENEKYRDDCSIEAREKQLVFLKKIINEKLELIKNLRENIDNSASKQNDIKKIEILFREIDDIKNVEELLKNQIEYLKTINRFFEANTRLSFTIAMKYRTKYWANQIDLIQAANIGLLKAIKKYNLDKGYRFSTYASYWIRQGAIRYLNSRDEIIRKPVNIEELLRRIRKATKKLELTKENPTIEEIANVSGISVDKIKELLFIEKTCDTISLQKKVNDEELGNFIIDINGEKQDEVIGDLFTRELKLELETLLEKLEEREREIIIKRFGLNGEGTKTLAEIGKEYHLTRERIRQIEAKALIKLRRTSSSRKLRDFL